MRIDFTGVSDGFEPIPEGEYDCVFTKYDIVAESKSSGKPYVNMEYTIEDEEYQGRKVWNIRSLQPQSLWALKGDLIKLGAYEDQLSGETDIDEVLESLVGNECRVKVGQHEYEGETRNDVKGLLSREHAF